MELINVVSPVFLSFGDGYDMLNITSNDPDGVTGSCYVNRCDGFGTLGNGIEWTPGVDAIYINGGFGDDAITFVGVAQQQVLTVDLGRGSDEYTIQATVDGFTAIRGDVHIVVQTPGGFNRLFVDLGTFIFLMYSRMWWGFVCLCKPLCGTRL